MTHLARRWFNYPCPVRRSSPLIGSEAPSIPAEKRRLAGKGSVSRTSGRRKVGLEAPQNNLSAV